MVCLLAGPSVGQHNCFEDVQPVLVDVQLLHAEQFPSVPVAPGSRVTIQLLRTAPTTLAGSGIPRATPTFNNALDAVEKVLWLYASLAHSGNASGVIFFEVE